MVHLDRIYTRAGDDGKTSLANGDRVPKTAPRIVALGVIDELNAVLGVAIAHASADRVASGQDDSIDLTLVQNDLFDLGADVAVPESSGATDAGASATRLCITAERVARLESWIDEANERLEPLTSFVLPGGSIASAHLHHARAVCRRAEVAVHALAAGSTEHQEARRYLNRLSDLLFVLARIANDDGRTDVLWKPGGN